MRESDEKAMDMRSPFVVSISDLPRQEGAQREHSCTFAAPKGTGVDLLKVPEGSPLDAALIFTSVSEGVFVQGSVRTHAEGSCARCLAPLSTDICEQIAEIVYYPESLHALEDTGQDDIDELPVIDSDHIDLEPIVRDAVVLALPLRPLCSPDCQGLCSECGERWEDLPEDHTHEFLDPRFSALDQLAQEMRATETGECV